MSTRYETAKRVTESRTAEMLEGALLDVTTARAMIAVFETLTEHNRERFDAIPLDRLITFIWKAVTPA